MSSRKYFSHMRESTSENRHIRWSGTSYKLYGLWVPFILDASFTDINKIQSLYTKKYDLPLNFALSVAYTLNTWWPLLVCLSVHLPLLQSFMNGVVGFRRIYAIILSETHSITRTKMLSWKPASATFKPKHFL